jgi:hypothetical protein
MLWAGFVQLLSGIALWVTKATPYSFDITFIMKVALVVAGLALTVVLNKALAQLALW